MNCGCFTPDGKSVVSGSQDGSLRVWNPKTGDSTVCMQRHGANAQSFHSEGIVSLAVTKDSQIALSGSEEGGVFLSQLANGRVAAELKGEQSI